MEQPILVKLAALAETEAAVERSIDYLHGKMVQFLKKNERVLICFPKRDDACCKIVEQVVLACGCIPVWLGEDWRWITILKTAFTSKCNCIIGPPLLLLGLSKVAKHMGTPLFARNVLASGYPCPEWIVDAVERGLDCRAWGCYDPGIGAVIAGFSCGNRIGVHIREEEYGVEIVDRDGKPLADGETGNIVLYPKSEPALRIATGDTGKIDRSPCQCGCGSPRIVDMGTDKEDLTSLFDMGENIHYWSSVLDCRLERTECGLELEAVVFQGEKLPKFPSCARMVIRPWRPETDAPFDHQDILRNRLLSGKNH